MMNSCEVTAILRDFSISDNSSKWEVTDYYLRSFLFPHGFFNAKLLFYADGNCKENKGYVSIICSGMFPIHEIPLDDIQNFEIRYFFSVVDISENKRFTQSILYILDRTTPRESINSSIRNCYFGLDRYLKREILLNDPAELLPGDCLTISVEIECLTFSSIPDFTFVLNLDPYPEELEYNAAQYAIKTSFVKKFCFSLDKRGRLCIPLDTIYGRKLCHLSGFFQRASDTSLSNSTARKVFIPDEEMVSFCNLCNILFEPIKKLVVKSIEDICQVYVIADKYDFKSAIDVCRQIIKAFLCTTDDLGGREHVTQSVPDIIKLADEYRDSDLKDTINTYQESKEKFGTNDYAIGKYLKERIFSDWKFVSRELGNQFSFSRITKPGFESFV